MLLTIKFLIQPPQNIQLSVTESCTVASRCCKLLRQIGQQLHAVLAHLLQRKGAALFTVQQIIQRNMKRFRQCCRVFQRRHGSIVFIQPMVEADLPIFSPNCFCDKCASLRNLQMRLPISNIPNGPLPLPYSVPFDTPIYLLYNQKNNSNSAILGKILDNKGGKRLCLQQMPASTRRAKMPKRRIFPCAYWFAMTTQPLPVSWRKR